MNARSRPPVRVRGWVRVCVRVRASVLGVGIELGLVLVLGLGPVRVWDRVKGRG